MSEKEYDVVDRIMQQWGTVRPDVDVSPLAVIGRISRLSRLLDRHLAENFARHDIEAWMFDVLATLRRSGEPYELAAGDLVRHTMVTTGAITNRIDRLEKKGLVERKTTTDRRKVIVSLTSKGYDLANQVIVTHQAAEQEILEPLSEHQRNLVAGHLRTLSLHLGDEAPPAT